MNWLQKKYWWIVVVAIFLAITFIAGAVHYRFDLTAEKRFSLSEPTKQLLGKMEEPVRIQVFLTGDLPADYKKLSLATKDLLADFRDRSHKVRISFEIPGEGLNDTAKASLYDSLSRLGVVFERNEDVTSANKSTSQIIMPSALVTYGDQQPVAIDLRSSRTVFKTYNVVNDNPEIDKEATRNAAEALLEFKFADAIDKLTRTKVPTIAYLVGNGEAPAPKVYDLMQSLRNQYRFGIFDLKKSYPNPKEIDALLIVKPTQPFTDEDKLKLDQYIMHGGKVVWAVDKLYAELDSLMRSQADFVAFDRNLNLDDILFKYGVRINGDLLQDLNCSKIPVVRGYNPDGSPQMIRLPWPYYPFLSAHSNNPISKNLDRVLPIFPSSIDTVSAPGIRKTVLLASDTNSRTISSPAMVSLNATALTDDDFRTFNKSYVPVAVLLEGQFKSLFANRLTPQIQDSVAKALGLPFAASSATEGKQIVVSDGDIFTNAVTNTSGPLPMGMIPFENYRFANREFFQNSIDYLVNASNIFVARNKEFTLRLLDKRKVEEEKIKWQIINIVLPIGVILLIGVLFQWRRKKKFAYK